MDLRPGFDDGLPLRGLVHLGLGRHCPSADGRGGPAGRDGRGSGELTSDHRIGSLVYELVAYVLFSASREVFEACRETRATLYERTLERE